MITKNSNSVSTQTQNILIQSQRDLTATSASIVELLGSPIGLGTLRALEPRVLLDAAAMTTLAEAVQTQSTDDALAWRQNVGQPIAPGVTPFLSSLLPELFTTTTVCPPEQNPTSLLPSSKTGDPSISRPQPAELPEATASDQLELANETTVTATKTEIVFIDSAVLDLQPILDSISENSEIVYIDSSSDGVAQMAAALAGRSNVDAIHIISHGDEGQLNIGSSSLNLSSISGRHSADLAIINQALSANGDILIYGCDFGAGSVGQATLEALALATGADIAASDDTTGAQSLGGDWQLESTIGEIEAFGISPLSWAGTLDLTITNVGTIGASGLAQEILGSGVTINSATYSGAANQAGIFATGAGASFGSNVLTFTEGAIFSTGTAVSVAGPNNSANFTVDAIGGIDGDTDFDGLAGGNTFDASFIVINFTPDIPPGASSGDTGRMTMEIVFGSDEYNEYVYGNVNDTLAVIVNGVNQATVPNGLAIGIDTINDAANFNPAFGGVAFDPNPEHTSAGFESANPSLYVNNAGFNTQMDGFTITIPVTFDVIVGQANTIKMGIADTGDAGFDSWMFIKADSGQTVIIAENDSITTPTNVPNVIDVTANDYDLQGDPLFITHILGQPVNVGDTITLASGVDVTVGTGGNLTITGDGTNTANDAFTYAITDGNGGTSTAFVNVNITAPFVNTPPVAVNDAGSTSEDTQLSVPVATGLVLSNDSDADGDTLTISAINGVAASVNSQITLVSGALLTVNADGSYDYDPNGAFEALAAGETTTDSFNYTISDGNGGTASATVTLTINGANDLPVAVADTATTDEDTAISQSAANGLITPNDSDPDTTDVLTVSQVNGLPANVGTQITLASGALLTVNADGSYDYDPNGVHAGLGTGQNATESFTYQVSDGNGGTSTASVTITINGADDIPVLNLDPDNDNATPGDNTDDGADDGGFEVTFTENDAPVGIVDVDVSVIDPEDDIVEMVITLANGQIGDTINFPSVLPGNISAAVLPGSTLVTAGVMTLTFTGDASTTNADWTSVLQALTFNPTTNDIHNPNPADRNINIQVSDLTSGLSPVVTTIVHVVPENDPPTLDLDDDNSSGANAGNYNGSYVENAIGLPISDGVLISDLDHTDLASVTITLTNGEIGDVLNIGALPAGISLQGVAPTNLTASGPITITLAGAASLADYQTAIAAVTFSSDSEDPAAGTRNINVVGNDGSDDTPTRTAFITVVPVNDPPVPIDPLNPTVTPLDPNAVIPAQSGADGSALTPLDTAQFFADPDDTVLTFSLGPTVPAWVSINATTGEITGTPPANASQNSNNGTPGSYDVVVIGTDPGGLTGQTTAIFAITNPAPVAVDDTLAVTEDAGNLTGSIFAANGTPTGDIDPDGDTITVSQVDGLLANVASPTAGSTGGLFTINANGTFVFDQNGEFNDLAVGETRVTTIDYQIDDGEGGTDTATITLTVTGTNDVPTAVSDVATTDEDTSISIAAATGLITPNDTDPDSTDTLNVTLINGAATIGSQITLPSGALLQVNADGSYDYDPNGAFEDLGVGESTSDNFTYTISDGNGGSDSATVTININGVNDAPNAVNDTGTVTQDSTITTSPATGLINPNDTDADVNDTLTVSLVNGVGANVGSQITLPSGALLNVQTDGSYVYDPNGVFDSLAVGETDTDSFSYAITDGNGGTSAANVTLTITGINDAPTALPDSALTDEDSAISIAAAAGLIDPNDSDPDTTDVLSVTAINGSGPVGSQITLPSGAFLTVNANGSYDYDPNGAFENLAVGESTTDSFTYTISDGNGGSDSATVTININGVNDAPIAVNDTINTDEDSAISANATNGLIIPNDSDPDSSDTLEVSALNGVAASIGTQITLPSGALITLASDGSYTYDPNGAFESLALGDTGTDSFIYTVSDGNGGTADATVNVSIAGVNDIPVVIDPLNPTVPPSDPDNIIPDVAYSDGEPTTIIDASLFIVDPDGDTLTFSASDLPPGLSIDPVSGEISGMLEAGASQGGSDPVNAPGVYQVVITGQDIHGASITTTVDYTITNIAPTAVDDSASTTENAPASGNVITGPGTDSDGAPDSDSLKVTRINGMDNTIQQPITGSAGGIFKVSDNGDWTFDPGNDFNALALGESNTTSITYQISDGNGGTDTAVLTVTVNGSNDAPVVAGPLPASNFNDGETITPIDTTGAFSNPTTSPLTYGASGLPAGLIIDPATGVISGTLENSASLGETYPVTITATLPNGQQFETGIIINVANVDPMALDDTVVTALDTPLIISPLTNDLDGAPDSDALIISLIISGPVNGIAAINADGTITYSPNTGFSGVDTIVYEVSDGQGGLDVATISISVDVPAPNVPVATPIANENLTDGETIAPIDISGNFTDPNGDILTYSAINLPAGLSLDAVTGEITGTLASSASQNGPYSVIVTASDPLGGQVSEILVIGVTNPLPIANNDSVDTALDSAVNFYPAINDSDPDGDAIEVVLINVQPTNGNAVINADGSVTYTPNTGFVGTDTFTYILQDADGGRDEASVSVNVATTGLGTPIVTPISPESVNEGSPITPIGPSGNFTDPNGDPLTYSAIGLPPGLVIDPNTGLITGTPENDASENGPYTVEIIAVDPAGNQVTGPMVIEVNNPVPIANPDNAETPIDTPVVIDVLANDSDPDGDPLTISATTPPTNGSIIVDGDGTITYTPNSGFSGSDSFTYTIIDAQGATSTETVTLAVSTAPTIPQTLPPIAAISANDGATPAVLNVAATIIDPDGDTLTWAATGLPPGLSIDANTGQISGTINGSASQGGPTSDGNYSATITAQDTSGETISTTLDYAIVNLAPDAKDDALTHDEDNIGSGNIFVDNGSGIDADTAPDSDPITVSQVDGASANVGSATDGSAGGKFTISANGDYTFNPGFNFQDLDVGENRTTSITYQISDGQGGFDTATITLTVTGANDAPVVTNPNIQSGQQNIPSVPLDPGNIIPDQAGLDSVAQTPMDMSPYFFDVDDEPLTFTIDPASPSAPSWLVIDQLTGIVTGTPPANASQGGVANDGVYQIILRATDPDGAFVTTTIDFTIANVAPIVLSPLPDLTDTAGYTVTHPSAPSFNDPDGDVLEYSATGLPPGLTINSVTGEISGTIEPSAVSDAPASDGEYQVTITADDNQGGLITSSFNYKVLPLPFVEVPDPRTPLDPFDVSDPEDEYNPTRMILTKAIDEIAHLGPHQGLFDAKYPVTEAIHQIDPLGPFTRLGNGNHPISDLNRWIEESRALLAKDPSDNGIASQAPWLGGDAAITLADSKYMARSIIVGQFVMVELFGEDFNPQSWSLSTQNNLNIPAWAQNIDGRTLIMLRPADLQQTTIALTGPSASINLNVDLVTGQLTMNSVPERITAIPIFSEQLEQLQTAELTQVQALFKTN